MKGFGSVLLNYIKRIVEKRDVCVWKLLFDLANLAKKECMFFEAKCLFKICVYVQPFCADIWAEYSKMEEDYGNLLKARKILLTGLNFCRMNEVLVIKYLKIQEKIGDINEARRVLSKLKYTKLEKSWRIFLEGALLEIRLGCPDNAQRIFRTLAEFFQVNGQINFEYAKFEECLGQPANALRICYDSIYNNVKYCKEKNYF